jgi:hypothetical protein
VRFFVFFFFFFVLLSCLNTFEKEPGNILLTENLSVRVCDFGLSRSMLPKSAVSTTGFGTILYSSPEMVRSVCSRFFFFFFYFSLIFFSVANGAEWKVL